VLPFTNRSAEADTAFFVDGVHDDLLTQLAKIGALKVISRTSVMEYRDTTKNLRQIGEELGVSTIMEGAVQRVGDRVRINAQLIDAETDEHLWAETFDRELSAQSVFELQSDIARAIANALQATLSPMEEERLGRALTNNLDALAAYQRARQLDDEVAFTGTDIATLEARRAVELDPQFTAAWALLARILLASWWSGNEDPRLREEAWQAIEAGRAIDPASLELRIAEGYYNYWGHRRYEQALEILEPALEIAPNDAELHEVLAYVNRRAGRFDQAVAYLLKAHELSPRSFSILYSVSETYALLRQQERSEFYLRKLEALAPTAPRTYQLRAKIALEFFGDFHEAAAQIGAAAHDIPWLMARYLDALMLSGQIEKALEIINGWGTDEKQVGRIFMLLPEVVRGKALFLSGRKTDAIATLKKAIARIDSALAEQPNHFGYLMARCQVLGYLGRSETVGQACQIAFDHFYDDAMDRNLVRTEIAAALAVGGDPEAALTFLEQVLSEQAGPTLIRMRASPVFVSLHDNPRWQALKEFKP
jgi:TolB-like protein/predicted Zn-dependent protease